MKYKSPNIGSFKALLPFLIFIAIYLGAGIYFQMQGVDMAFYQFPSVTAMFIAVLSAFCLGSEPIMFKFGIFSKGAANDNIMTMLMIYILAGAFSAVAAAMGGRDATVNLGISMVPAQYLTAGIFLISAFMGTATGTSMGTVAAIIPIAAGIGEKSGISAPLIIAACVGGAMFGDNLSIISDTTIAATRSQGAQMRDKFRENFKIALPAAIATVILLATLGEAAPVEAPDAASPWLVLPYVVVLGLALAGLDVVLVLGIGLVVSGVFGFVLAQEYDAVSFAGDIYLGFESMVEITLLSILIGGLAALIKATGGLAWLAQVIAKFARGHTGRRSGELSIAALAAGSDALTANNTVAILVTGSLAKDIAQRHGISPRRAASVLDIFACVVQGVLPYGAQILLAASLAAVSPLALAGSVYYCWLLALSAIGFMLWPRRAAAPR